MSNRLENKLENKVAVITGGTSGIGEATVELFVNEGARVVFCGRSEDKGRALADRVGGNAVYVKADVMSEADIAATIDTAVNKFGGVDILFNNAGGPTSGTITEVTGKPFNTPCSCCSAAWFSALNTLYPTWNGGAAGPLSTIPALPPFGMPRGTSCIPPPRPPLPTTPGSPGYALGRSGFESTAYRQVPSQRRYSGAGRHVPIPLTMMKTHANCRSYRRTWQRQHHSNHQGYLTISRQVPCIWPVMMGVM